MRKIIKELGKDIQNVITGENGKNVRTAVLAGATLLGVAVAANDPTYSYKASANDFVSYVLNGYKAAVVAPTPEAGDFTTFVVDARDGTGLNSSDNARIKLEKVPGDPGKVYIILPSTLPNPPLVNAFRSNMEFGPASGKTIKDDYVDHVSPTSTMGGPLFDSSHGVPSGSFNQQIPIGSRAPIIKKNHYDVQKRSRGTPDNGYTSRTMKR